MSASFDVLLSCAGRRNYLIDYFQKALGASGEVFAADASPHAPSIIEASGRGIVLPPVTDPGYFDRLLECCRENNVRMLLSLNDFELPLLARQAARFRET